MDASIILTWRCDSRYKICYTWKNPFRKEKETTVEHVKKLPKLCFVNVRGGEPFLRQDIDEIIGVVRQKVDRIVISTNGMVTDRTVKFYKKQKNKEVGVRVSLEGLFQTGEALRAIPGGFDKSLRPYRNLRA